MHEMSIALSILDIAAENAAQENAERINQVEVTVGRLSGVLLDSLKFCFEVAKNNTIAKDAKLDIIDIPGRGHCQTCKSEFNIDSLFALCPNCNGISINILQGKELSIKSINID
jgi:hydrogenase nickel incorporation protein HypA/HybF